MQIRHALEQLVGELLDSLLGNLLISLEQLTQRAADTVLEYDPEVIPRLVPVVEPHDVGVPVRDDLLLL